MILRHTIHWIVLGWTFVTFGCGSTVVEQALTLEMYGVYEIPDGASGNYTPISQTYTFEGMTLTKTGATQALSLYSGDPTEYTIINRPQIIYKRDISDQEGETFERVSVTFSADVKGQAKLRDTHTFTLDEPEIVLEQAFAVETGKGVRITIYVQWDNTVTRDDDAETESMSQPTYRLVVEES